MNDNGKMMLFSFLAYYDFLQVDTNVLEKNVKTMLESMEEYLHFSEISWGPCANKGLEVLTDSLMFVVKNNNKHIDEYTLVIRGTNPLSIQSWLFQDLNVAGMVPWSRQSPFTLSKTSYISKATDTSLSIHKKLKYNTNTLLDWVLSLFEQPNAKKIKLNICGHSLGGLMATTFGLWLSDELTQLNKNNLVDLEIYAYAAPSAGNGEYVDYLDNRLKGKYHSLNNYFDIVSHVWDQNDVCDVLPGIYGDLIMSKKEEELYSILKNNIIGMNYQKLGNVVPIKSSFLKKFSHDYFIQAAAQHILPYLVFSLLHNPIISIEVFSTLLVDIVSVLIKDIEDLWNDIFGMGIKEIDLFKSNLIGHIKEEVKR